MHDLTSHFAQSARSLARKPGFTAVVVLTLALGIGANIAVFSVVNAVVLRPLPFSEPDRLLRLWEQTPEGQRFSMSEPTFLDLQASARTLADVAATPFPPPQLTLQQGREPERLTAMACTASTFAVLGVQPALGRSFSADEAQPGHPGRVLVIGHDLWVRRFGADPGIVGKPLPINGERWTVVGVLPAGFRFMLDPDVWIPFGPSATSDRQEHRLEVFGRLAPGATAEAARAELSVLAARLGTAHPDSNRGWGFEELPFPDWLTGRTVKRIALVLQLAAALVLLLVVANVSNLLTVRVAAREREMAVRATLGATRGQLLREVAAEAGLLSLLAAVLGLGLATLAAPVIRATTPFALPRIDATRVDASVLAFAFLVTLLAGALASVAPGLRVLRANLADWLRAGRGVAGGGSRRLRDVLVVGQLALATLLLVGASLLAASFRQLAEIDPGFDSRGVLAVNLSLPEGRYPEASGQVRDFYQEVLRRVGAIPGVTSVGATMVDPFSGLRPANQVGREDASERDSFVPIQWRAVTRGFLHAAGVPLQRGSGFSAAAASPAAMEAVVSTGLAARLWPGEDALGKRLRWAQPGGPLATVVGVIGGFRDVNLTSPAEPMLLLNHELVLWPQMTLLVRVAGDPTAVAPLVRRAIREVDPALPVPEAWPLADNLRNALAGPRLNAWLMGIFACLALVLAMVGLYGLLAQLVAQQTQELGVRMALGATRRNILGRILAHSLKLAAVGVALGLGGALLAGRGIESILYETRVLNPMALGLPSVILTLVVLAASTLPAWRAAGTDPAAALRAE